VEGHRRQRPARDPTGFAPGDSFADGDSGRGFEREAAHIFDTLRLHGIRNSVWITTDVHFATGFVIRPFPDDRSWTAFEITSGPLNAGVFPRLDVDPTFHPRAAVPVRSAVGGRHPIVRRGHRLVQFRRAGRHRHGELTVSIVNGLGKTVFRRSLPTE
jgi:alkaline phosphatase D